MAVGVAFGGGHQQGAQATDSFGQGELFADQAFHETAAADFAAGFQAVVDAQQFAPAGEPGGFAFEQLPEDDAVAAQERAGDVFQGVGVWFSGAGWGFRKSRTLIRPFGPPSPKGSRK